MTLRQLTLFKAVAEHLSFTRAAAELRLTQPAVSIQIKQLENNIGMPLFEQIGKKIYLTDAGQLLQSAAEDIFIRLEDLETSLNELQETIKGQLRLSIISTASYFFPHVFSAFNRLHPEVQLRLKVTNRMRVLQQLSSNEDDLVIMGQVPDDLNVQAFPFLANPLVVIAPPTHPLVGKKKISLQRVAEETFLVREQGSGTRLAMESKFAAHNILLKTEQEFGSVEAIKQGVSAGLGLSVLSDSVLSLELAAGKLCVLDVEEFPLMRDWYVAHLSEKKLSLVAKTFLEFLLDQQKAFMLPNDLR